MKKESFFSWAPNNIPGRRIENNPSDPIVLYGQSKNFRASELGTIQPFVLPESWADEAKEFIKCIKRPKESVIFDSQEQDIRQKEMEAVA